MLRNKTIGLLALVVTTLVPGLATAAVVTPLQALTACHEEARSKGVEGESRRELVTACVRKHVRSRSQSGQHDIQASVQRASERLEGVRKRINATVAQHN